MKALLHRPQSVFARRALFQIHLWTGVLVGLYVFVVCLTGAALVFRIDMQRALHPDLFTPGPGPHADAATILERVRDAYPEWRVSGIDAPTTARPTYLAYVAQGRRFLTLLVDPASGRILGELPERSFVRTIQDLHFDLLAGRTGRIVNGVGGILLLVLCATGLVIWWPGVANWRRGLTVDFRRSWKRVTWDLHGAVGIWTVMLIAMWAVTGVYFAFPSQFRAAVNAISPLTVAVTPQSDPAGARIDEARPTWRELIAQAQREAPNQHIARALPPSSERAAFLVMFSPVAPTPLGAELTSVYLDQYTGEPLTGRPAGRKGPSDAQDGASANGAQDRNGDADAETMRARRSAGDVIMAWVAPLHVGNFGGTGVRVAWLILGLSPPLLFVTGFLMWWTRVVRPRWRPGSGPPEGGPHRRL